MRGSNADVVRRRNLSLVLRRAHELTAVSRSQLTRETGLNRSTIAALVSELVQLGLVVETNPDPETQQVGRPSPVIVPREQNVAFVVHPEIDAIEVAMVALGGRVLARSRRVTPGEPTAKEAVAVATELIRVLRSEGEPRTVVGVGLAIPGLVRERDGVVTTAPHLRWNDEPVSAMLRASTGLTVFAANDASLGAIAESVRGAGRGVDDMVYLNGGASGIGGGIIAGGAFIAGASGFAGEIGHSLVRGGGRRCHCGRVGCLETEVARAPLLRALGLATDDADRLPQALNAHLATAGPSDPVRELVDRQREYLAVAIGNIVNILNPSLVVLGGFLQALLDSDPSALSDEVGASALHGPDADVRIVAASLGSSIVAIGAAELAFETLLNDPAGTLDPPSRLGAGAR